MTLIVYFEGQLTGVVTKYSSDWFDNHNIGHWELELQEMFVKIALESCFFCIYKLLNFTFQVRLTQYLEDSFKIIQVLPV